MADISSTRSGEPAHGRTRALATGSRRAALCDREGVQCQVTRRPFQGLEVREIACRGAGDVHALRHPALRGNRSCLLVLQLEGRSRLVQDATEVPFEAGDMMLIDAGDTSRWRCFGRSRQVWIQLPRGLLQARVSLSQPATTVPISGASGIGALLRGLIASLNANAGAISGRDEQGVRDALVDLALTALAARRYPCADRRPTRPGPSRHWPLLLQYIDACLPDPTLCPGKAAAAHGISIRHLHRLFKQAGTSFGDYVRARRLERCRRDLADPRLHAIPVTEIAYAWGFSDSSHFSRSFRAAFGLTARQFRAAASRACAENAAPR